MSELADMKTVVRIAVVGHVDHGKSTLIGRLAYEFHRALGDTTLPDDVDWAHAMDQLAEEREGALTIETTQTVLETPERRLVLVDVPGHRELLENMVTGATCADAAILVVAADEGVREQTRRHAGLLSLLGLEQVIVCINKMDAVAYSRDTFEQQAAEVTECFNQLSLAPLAIIPTAAADGENLVKPSTRMDWYDEDCLAAWLAEIQAVVDTTPATRFVVQSVENDVVFGRVLGAAIAEGDELTALPVGNGVVVDTIYRFPEDHRPAAPGESVALRLSKSGIGRGRILCDPQHPVQVSSALRGRIFWLAKVPLQEGDQLVWRCATQSVPVTVTGVLLVSGEDSKRPEDAVSQYQFADIELTAEQRTVCDREDSLNRFSLERRCVPVAIGTMA